LRVARNHRTAELRNREPKTLLPLIFTVEQASGKLEWAAKQHCVSFPEAHMINAFSEPPATSYKQQATVHRLSSMVQTMRPHEISNYILGPEPHPLLAALAAWLASPRFASFAEQHRDKIRKKVRGRGDDESLADLRAELGVAALLLRDKRILLEYERYAAEKLRGPDFSASIGSGRRFDVEVSRLRGQDDAPPAYRLAGTLCDKVGQLRPGLVNIVVVASDTPSVLPTTPAEAVRQLMERATNRDERFFARHGYRDLRDFHRDYLRLSAVVLRHIAADGSGATVMIWENPQARQPLPSEVASLLR
jgi:hypothetical protein